MNKHAALLGLLLFACDKEKAKTPPSPAEPPPATSAVAAVEPAGSHVRGHPEKLEKFEMPEVRIKEDSETTVKVAWKVPPGTALNDEAPFRVRWNRSDGLVEAPTDAKSTGSAVKDGYSVRVKPLKGAPNPTLAGEIDLVVCDAVNHSICLPVRRRVELGFIAAKDAGTEVKIEMPLPAAH
jgi:hypothetical protein